MDDGSFFVYKWLCRQTESYKTSWKTDEKYGIFNK